MNYPPSGSDHSGSDHADFGHPDRVDPDFSGQNPSDERPLFRSAVILGLWPIAGVTTIGVTNRDAESTLATAIDLGITVFDTAYSYGLAGESDRYLGRAIGGDVDRFHVIGKVGQRYLPDATRVIDCRPDTLRRDAEESLRRIGIPRFGTLMLHSVDPEVEIERSAEALLEIKLAGLAQRIGVCNATDVQRRRFHSICPCQAIQCPLNLLQRQSLATVIPGAADAGGDVFVYWTLMKGLLAGKITRDHVFPAGDSRPSYEVFQGEQRLQAHRVVDELAEIAEQNNCTVAELSVSWALSQPGVSGALVGARRPDQIREVAAARPLTSETLARIDALIA